MDKEINDVNEFHKKLGLWVDGNHLRPGHLAHATLLERIQFLQEELDELADAMRDNDLVAQADALIDLVYVAKGTALMLGLGKCWAELWDEVQRANMSKVPGTTHRGNKVDAKKPEGWRPPHHTPILKQHGYDHEKFVNPSGQLFLWYNHENMLGAKP